ncbi:hypothetical protein E0485_04725 [Paenibacillus albiflavus]|uniref:YdbS-like PH domain-containing protein n=1 Tax=Paenibacillus albiflavus TaxID=2545760 RepID=A0A4R4EK78_9BACL|nr:PH domain-containing protein [Paenibacillus albiflavus]TCZ80157.1 hypothetical protein E0485_04725 [Paenibacillus albiflavus]
MKKSDAQLEQDYLRLHPASIVFFMIRGVKELYALLPLLTILYVNVSKAIGKITTLFLVIAIAVVYLILSASLSWYFYQYRVESGALLVKQGVWKKTKTWISKERIQSINTSEHVIDRIFGLVQLQVETAGGSKPEAILSSISLAEAARISAVLEYDAGNLVDAESSRTEAQAVATMDEPKMTLSSKRLFLHSSLSSKFGVALVLISGLWQVWDDWFKSSDIFSIFAAWLGESWKIMIVIFILLFAWVAAIFLSYLTDYNFSLRLHDHKLIIERGLLEKKQVTLTSRRIQAIHMIKYPLKRLFGWVSVRAILAGITENKDKTTVLFPMVNKNKVEDMLHQFVQAYEIPQEWNKLTTKARRYHIFMPFLFSSIVVIPAIAFIPSPYGWFALLLPVLVSLYGLLAYKQTAWAVGQDHIAIQYGAFSHHHVIVPRRRIQWQRMTQTPFQARRGIASLSIALTSGKGPSIYAIRYAPEAEVRRIQDWLSREKRREELKHE